MNSKDRYASYLAFFAPFWIRSKSEKICFRMFQLHTEIILKFRKAANLDEYSRVMPGLPACKKLRDMRSAVGAIGREPIAVHFRTNTPSFHRSIASWIHN